MKSKTATVTQFRCEKCNAPYPLGADDVIATCPYCGYTFAIDGEEVQHLILPNILDFESVSRKVIEWLHFAANKTVGSGIVKNVELEEPKMQWIPAFRVEGEYESYYFGYKTEGSGSSRKYRRFEEKESGNLIEWVIARRHASTFGIDEFILSLRDTPPQKFRMDLAGSAPILNSEIVNEDAINRAEKNRKDRERNELLRKMDKLLDHRLDISPESSIYTHTPYWLVRYVYQKGTFRVAVSGATGEVLLGELPVTKRYRAKKWITSILLLVSASALFQILPYILIAFTHVNSSSGDEWMIPIGVLVISCLLWAGSIVMIGGALKYEIQVTSKGEERKDKSTLDGAMKHLGGKNR